MADIFPLKRALAPFKVQIMFIVLFPYEFRAKKLSFLAAKFEIVINDTEKSYTRLKLV